MKKFALLLAGLAVVSTAQADTLTKSRILPAKVRYGYVYDYAKYACPKAKNTASDLGQEIVYIREIADKHGMSSDERALLFLMCNMYEQGVRGDSLLRT